jgi:hypothetical protein
MPTANDTASKFYYISRPEDFGALFEKTEIGARCIYSECGSIPFGELIAAVDFNEDAFHIFQYREFDWSGDNYDQRQFTEEIFADFEEANA